jgi:hypothetical protein
MEIDGEGHQGEKKHHRQAGLESTFQLIEMLSNIGGCLWTAIG